MTKQLLLFDCHFGDSGEEYQYVDASIAPSESPSSSPLPTPSNLDGDCQGLQDNILMVNHHSTTPDLPVRPGTPSHYVLTSVDLAIINAVEKISKPCTPDEIIAELLLVDWDVKERTLRRHIERLGEYKVITRIKKGAYTK